MKETSIISKIIMLALLIVIVFLIVAIGLKITGEFKKPVGDSTINLDETIKIEANKINTIE